MQSFRRKIFYVQLVMMQVISLKTKEEHAQIPFHIYTATDELIYGKEIQLPLSLFGHFSALFSLSEQLVFYTSVCIMT